KSTWLARQTQGAFDCDDLAVCMTIDEDSSWGPASIWPMTTAASTPSDHNSFSNESASCVSTAANSPPEVCASHRINCSSLETSCEKDTQSAKNRWFACVPPGAIPALTYSHADGKTGTWSKKT